MTLLDVKKGEKVKILKLHSNNNLKQRLFSLGIIRGAEVEVVDCSISKSTIEVKVGNTLVALRSTEAKQIEVEVI